MSLQVVTVESVSGSDVVGVYLSEKLAKVAITTYVEKSGVAYKRKLVKKDSDEIKKMLYVEDTKEDSKKSVFVTTVPFDMPATGKSKKAKKDPNAPKKCLSGFMHFSNDHRTKVKEANPEASFGEVGRLVGEAWKGLNEKAKAVYTKRAETDKDRYTKELETYTSGATEDPTEPVETSKKPRPVKKTKIEVAA